MRMVAAVLLVFAMLCGIVPTAQAQSAAPAVSSRAAVLFEPESGRVLFGKNADEPLSMASTTKLMTALVAVRHLDASETVTVPSEAVPVEGSSMGLRCGDRITVHDLLVGLLLSSGNDAANALALLVSGSLSSFATLMNRTAKELGMSNTCFVTPSGLDEGEHHSTARDMARLGAEVLEDPLLSAICASKTAVICINGSESTVSNHNRLLWLYEDAVGLKTGYTIKSGKCLVSAARRDGITLVVASLNGGDYWNDHMRLYEYGFSRTEATRLPIPELPDVAVAGGTAERARLTAQASAVVLLDDEREHITCEWEVQPFIWAPVAVSEQVGVLRYYTDERVVCEIPLLAASDISPRPAVTYTEKWKRQLLRLFAALTR